MSRLPLLILFCVLVTLIVYLQWPQAQREKPPYQRIVAVKTIKAALADFVESVEALGTARANEQVLITSKYSDLVEQVYFRDGQQVVKGDVLVRLNNQEEQAKVRELSANLAESVSQLNRLSELLASKATSTSLVEQQEAKTKAIRAQLISARAKLNDLTIKAPFTGVLGFREISRGAYIGSGDVITSLDDLSSVKVDFSLPEHLLTAITKGKKISARNIAYKNEQFTGFISSIDSRIDASTRNINVRAELTNKTLKLRPGMLLNIRVVLQVENLLQLPESSIIPIENKHYVFVIQNNKAVRKKVIIGRRHPGMVELVSGVKPGEQVVVEGALKLRNGTSVRVLETDGIPVVTQPDKARAMSKKQFDQAEQGSKAQ